MPAAISGWLLFPPLTSDTQSFPFFFPLLKHPALLECKVLCWFAVTEIGLCRFVHHVAGGYSLLAGHGTECILSGPTMAGMSGRHNPVPLSPCLSFIQQDAPERCTCIDLHECPLPRPQKGSPCAHVRPSSRTSFPTPMMPRWLLPPLQVSAQVEPPHGLPDAAHDVQGVAPCRTTLLEFNLKKGCLEGRRQILLLGHSWTAVRWPPERPWGEAQRNTAHSLPICCCFMALSLQERSHSFTIFTPRRLITCVKSIRRTPPPQFGREPWFPVKSRLCYAPKVWHVFVC